MKYTSICFLRAVCWLWVSAVVLAQGPGNWKAPVPDGERNIRLEQLSSLNRKTQDYQLGPGDLIEVGVFGVEGYRHTLRVSAAGTIKLPLIDAVRVAGLTAVELEKTLAAQLDGDVFKNPQVSVFVKEFRSQPVFVLGSVTRPGQYQISQQMNLIDVLSMAGGLLANAGDEATLQRRPAGAAETAVAEVAPSVEEARGGPGAPKPVAASNVEVPGSERITINLVDLLEKGDPSLNIPVQGGDVVHVKERLTRVFYVIGEVGHGGAFQLPLKQELRLTQALSWAGGPAKTAKMGSGILVRYDADGKRTELPVDFAAILKGKKDDFAIMPNDVIFIPGSNAKNLLYGLLGTLPSSISNVPYAVGY